MDEFLAGYRRFRAQGWPEQRKTLESLARDGQRPQALVIACIDSRVDPAMIFDAAPGDILVVRNIANLVPPYAANADCHGTSAALEFGVKILGVSQIVVLGHSFCGGVQALLNGIPNNAHDFVTPWMSIAQSARARALHCDSPDERQQCCEHEVVKTSLANLMTFPWIAVRVASGQLELHGAWFDIRTGTLMISRKDGTFAASPGDHKPADIAS